jgi:hypothetical protein
MAVPPALGVGLDLMAKVFLGAYPSVPLRCRG